MAESHQHEQQLQGHLAREAKNFFSLGGSLSMPLCAVAVHYGWTALESLWPGFQHHATGLILSLAVVYAIAYLPPEPTGYPNAGRQVITRSEFIFGLFSALTIYVLALGFHK